jgi:hypothetical protein
MFELIQDHPQNATIPLECRANVLGQFLRAAIEAALHFIEKSFAASGNCTRSLRSMRGHQFSNPDT